MKCEKWLIFELIGELNRKFFHPRFIIENSTAVIAENVESNGTFIRDLS